jgi:hypothetical protein
MKSNVGKARLKGLRKSLQESKARKPAKTKPAA